ncbi:hypothetical protein GCM10027347_57990 [Larkinella harenae]
MKNQIINNDLNQKQIYISLPGQPYTIFRFSGTIFWKALSSGWLVRCETTKLYETQAVGVVLGRLAHDLYDLFAFQKR